MKVNTQSTKTERLAMLGGTIMATAGAITFLVEGVFFAFAHLALVLAAVLFILAGILIAGSHKLGEWLAGILS